MYTGQDRNKDEAWTTGWKIYKYDLIGNKTIVVSKNLTARA